MSSTIEIPVWLGMANSLGGMAILAMLVLYLLGKYECNSFVHTALWIHLGLCAVTVAWLSAQAHGL